MKVGMKIEIFDKSGNLLIMGKVVNVSLDQTQFIIKDKKPIYDAFLLGFSIYAVYETTTAAIFKDWNSWLVIMDSLWGGILFSLITIIIYKLISCNYV